jgi:hypothetical protein
MNEIDSDADTVLKISSKEYPNKSAPKFRSVVKLYLTNANSTITNNAKSDITVIKAAFLEIKLIRK